MHLRSIPSTRLWAALSVASALILVTGGSASAHELVAQPGPVAASAALEQAQQALNPDPAGGQAPDPSPALQQLGAALPALGEHERRVARSLLSRPTDGAADQYGDGYPSGADVSSVSGPHFCVFWVADAAAADAPNLADSDGDDVPDYVEAILSIAEYSYSVEVAPGPLGWVAPKPDTSGCGTDPSARADIYLEQLGSQGLFGYESPDPGQGQQRSQYGYLVLDNDYSQAEYGYADSLLPAKVTVAHELNHLLQQTYDSFQDVWMFEATAVWTEEQVYPQINDYVNYVSSFASNPGVSITDSAGAGGVKIYGSAVWNHWLDRGAGLGSDAIRHAWEVSGLTRPRDFAVAAYGRAIRDGGRKGFSDEFARFAAATAEWRTGHGGFPDAALYPDVRRKGKLRPGSRRRIELDHTAYRLFDVRGTRDGRLRLMVHAQKGVRTGIALVGREGAATSGAVARKTRLLARGGSGSVGLRSPGRFDRLTAVVANADGRLQGSRVTDYRGDDARFTLRLSR